MFKLTLRQKAIADGAHSRFSTEIIYFQQDKYGVAAPVRSTETEGKTLIRAKYMVVYDSNRSLVREHLGISVKGHSLLSHSLAIYFKTDISKYIRGKYNGVICINSELVRGFIRINKSGKQGFLVVNAAGKQGTEESRFPADGITVERAAELLRDTFGVDVGFEIELIAK